MGSALDVEAEVLLEVPTSSNGLLAFASQLSIQFQLSACEAAGDGSSSWTLAPRWSFQPDQTPAIWENGPVGGNCVYLPLK